MGKTVLQQGERMAENLLFNTALNKAMAICAGREMCCSDIRQKLLNWGIKDTENDKILDLLIRGKFIDEERFAIAFVKDRFRHNKWGRIKIGSALKMKKIPDETIRIAMDSINESEYADLLKSIIEKQRKTVKAKNQYDLKGKLMRHCLSKGFESHLLYDILNADE
jgi:regulatory protein